MRGLRHLLIGRRRWVTVLLALVLLARLLVPAGFMPTASADTITVELCSGYGDQKVELAIPGLAGKQQGEHGKGDSPCTFSGLSASSLAGAEAIGVPPAMRFAEAITRRALAVAALPFNQHLRPPLRGPPANP
jgi:hypothetical protein